MEFKIAVFNKNSFSAVQVEREGEAELIFDCRGYASAAPGAVVTNDSGEIELQLFDEINELISKLPKEKQDKLYQCYYNLEGIFQSFHEYPLGTTLDKLLSEQIKNIYDIVKFEDLREFVEYDRRFKLPPELEDDYVTNDKITPLYKEKTYLKSEYIDLLAAALGLRLMIPVWGGYLPIAGKEHGRNLKEYFGFQLMIGSSLFDSRAFVRLESYIRANLPDEDSDMGAIFTFLGSEEVPIYRMALAVIRKLAVAPLSAENDRQHLMKITFNYAFGNGSTDNKKLPNIYGRKILEKSPSGNEGSQEDNSSVWCVFKMKEQNSAGDLVVVLQYTNDYQTAAAGIDPTIEENMDALLECREKVDTLPKEFRASMEQKQLAAWVMSAVIPGVLIHSFDRQSVLINLAITQAILWHWGLHQLAILATASKIPLEEDEAVLKQSGAKISNKNLELMEAIYPYRSEIGKNESETMSIQGVRGVELLATAFSKHDWKPNCPKRLAKLHDRCDVTRHLVVSPAIRDELATLLIKLDSLIN